MHHRRILLALPVSALIGGLAALGCGSYDSPANTGGAPGAGGSGSPETGGAPSVGGGGGGDASGGADATGGSMSGSGGDQTGAGGGPPEAPPASCENVEACGGALEGVWFAQDSCLSLSGKVDLVDFGIGCTEGAITSGTVEVSGNWTVNADGSISDNANTVAELVFELEAKCLEVSGTVTICENISIPIASMGFDEIQCVESTVTAGGCTCTGSVNQQGGAGYMLGFNATTSGTYTSADNTMTVTGTGIEPLDYAYCVDGSFMIATPTTQTALGTTTGTIVFQKQQD